jgi:hypothetical protein
MRKAPMSKTHVIVVRWTFSAPVTAAEARRAVRDVLPVNPWPDHVEVPRDGRYKGCLVTARLATKKEAARDGEV